MARQFKSISSYKIFLKEATTIAKAQAAVTQKTCFILLKEKIKLRGVMVRKLYIADTSSDKSMSLPAVLIQS